MDEPQAIDSFVFVPFDTKSKVPRTKKVTLAWAIGDQDLSGKIYYNQTEIPLPKMNAWMGILHCFLLNLMMNTYVKIEDNYPLMLFLQKILDVKWIKEQELETDELFDGFLQEL